MAHRRGLRRAASSVFPRPCGPASRSIRRGRRRDHAAHVRVVAVTNLHNPSGARVGRRAPRRRQDRRIARRAPPRREVYAPFDDLVADGGVWASSARHLGANVARRVELDEGLRAGELPHRLDARSVVAGRARRRRARVERRPHAARARVLPASTRSTGSRISRRERVRARGQRERVDRVGGDAPRPGVERPRSGAFRLRGERARGRSHDAPRAWRGGPRRHRRRRGVFRCAERRPSRLVDRRGEARRRARGGFGKVLPGPGASPGAASSASCRRIRAVDPGGGAAERRAPWPCDRGVAPAPRPAAS